MWPAIRRLAEAEILAHSNAGARIVVLEAAVLFEAGWDDIGDEVWVVVVDRETAIDRCISRDGLARDAIENRLDAQLSNDERIAKAGVVIANSGSEKEMLGQLDQLLIQSLVNFVLLGSYAPRRMIARVGLHQQGRKIQTASLPVIDRRPHIQKFGRADQFIDGPHAELGHDLAQLFGQKEEVVDDILGRAFKPLAKFWVLGRHADRAGV